MERSDTMSVFPGIFDVLMENGSFAEKFNSQDFRDILATPNARNVCKEEEKLASYELWNNLDSDANLIDEDLTLSMDNISQPSTAIAGPGKKMVQFGDAIYLVDDTINEISKQSVMVIDAETTISESSSSPVSGISVPSLSLQPWKGRYDFVVGVQTSPYSNSKWAYSNLLKKLFLRPFDAVPVEVKVSSWIDGYINITPVYVSSQHKSLPVNRCHNHKITDEDKKVPYPEHIVKVDNPDANYRVDSSRYSVDIPLGCPAPGESGKLLYVKCGCWNTCTGGPSRKPFCLVFTLFSRFGEEVGRQILHLKVCACPVRDCGYSEQKHTLKEKHALRGSPKKGSGKMKMTKKKMLPPGKTVKKIKAEPAEQNYEQILVPSEISEEVKRFINRLMAEKYAKENNIQLPFPEC